MGMKASNAIATFFKYFVLILVGLIMIYPLLWMISATFKDNSEIFAGIGLWIKNPTLEGYKNALNNFGGSINILQAMLNTYSYVLPKVICTVVSACIAACLLYTSYLVVFWPCGASTWPSTCPMTVRQWMA